MKPSKVFVRVFPGSTELSRAAADLFASSAMEAVSARGRFICALSGGGTPRPMYELLAKPPYRETLPWDDMLFFWGDERCVPPNNAESSYNQAREAWLAHVPVPEKNIFRIKGELDPQLAAEDYARQLASVFSSVSPPAIRFSASESVPASAANSVFDFVLLGLGADGHTASLFPGSVETSGAATVAVTAHYQDRPANRVSLTPEVFNSARKVVFLVTGAEKAQAFASTLTGTREPIRLPAQRIQPADGRVIWLVDESAASLLPKALEEIPIYR
jgi:6-phosphogluconolactonase